MFHPIGPQNPTVYWRRRLAMLGGVVLLIVLIVLTFNEMRSDGASTTAANKSSASAKPSTSAVPKVAAPTLTTSSTSTTAKTSTTSSAARSAAKKTGTTKSKSATTTPVTACVTKNLDLRAVVGADNYKVGDNPKLQLQVTNTGSVPCTQNLADQDVEMRVYNGESRVWGSHDCKISPGSMLRTLNPKVPVLVSIKWSGLSSQPKCAGTRQRVNAGTYTLYAALAGRTGKATQFSIG